MSDPKPVEQERCFCGEPIYDVEDGIRTCGHLDEEPLWEDPDA